MVRLALVVSLLIAAALVLGDLWPRRELLFGLMTGLLLTGTVAPFIGPRLTVAALSMCLSVLLVTLVLPSGQLYMLRVSLFGQPPLGVVYLDSQGMRMNNPGMVARHRTKEFDATYTIDRLGWRVMPRPARPRGQIQLHGCSITFGQGVQDGETYAHLLASGPWSQYEVRNFSVMGWGPGAVYHSIERQLASGSPPKVVLYGWFVDHINRLQGVEDTAALRLEQLATAAECSKIEGAATREILHSALIVRAIHRSCQRKGIPFVLVMLPGNPPSFKPNEMKFRRYIRKFGIPTVALPWGGDPFYEDGHPRKSTHRRIADELARAPELADLLR